MTSPTLRAARPGDEPRLRALWREVFGDGEAFLDLFFSGLYAPQDALIGADEQGVAAMLFLLPMALVGPQGGRWALPYVYALATDPARRGEGWAHRLLAYAGRVAGERGAAGLCTVPATAALHGFFASAGFAEGLFTRRRALSPEEGAALRRDAAPAEPAAYNAWRRAELAGEAYIDLPDPLIAFQKGICRLGGEELCRLPGGAMAALEREGEALVWKDCLVPAGGRAEGFGMVKWFGPPPVEEAYLGLAFE